MNDKNIPSNGEACPACGSEILDWEISSLPTIAFKQHMYDACYLPTEEAPHTLRKETVVYFHEVVA